MSLKSIGIVILVLTAMLIVPFNISILANNALIVYRNNTSHIDTTQGHCNDESKWRGTHVAKICINRNKMLCQVQCKML